MERAQRKRVSPGALYSMLSGEFNKRRPAECATCRMPLPFVIDRPDEVSANWRIGTPAQCAHGCDRIIVQIAATYWPTFDVAEYGSSVPTMRQP